MRKKSKQLLAMVLAAAMLMSACGKKDSDNSSGKTSTSESSSQSAASSDSSGSGTSTSDSTGEDPVAPVEFEGHYTYNDSVATMSANWNPHTFQTNDESYPINFTTSSLYAMYFNDSLHEQDGKEDYEGYVVVPEMAKDFPEDVTKEVKKDHPEFGIPDGAESGYAWKVTLRDDLKFDDGTVINADTFVESLKRLLDPKLLNYRASDYYDGTYAIANAKKYALAGNSELVVFAEQGTTYSDYIADGGKEEDIYINISDFWGITTADGKVYASISDETEIRDEAVPEGEEEDYVSPKYLWDNYLGPEGVYAAYVDEYAGTLSTWEDGYPFENVGLYKVSDTELVYVFNNSLSGFYLMTYAMSPNFLIEPTLYDKCLTENKTAAGSVWSSTYNTSVETSRSYGPYKMSSYQTDKSMHFVRNDNWFGYTDGNHVYVDPEDGETYNMYMTDEIDTQVITEAATRKQMFLSGKLMTYNLQAEDFDEYRNSEFCYDIPGPTIYFMILNGFLDQLEKREASADFDKKTTDLQSMTLLDFRKAMAVSFDKELFVSTIYPADTTGFGLIGKTYIYDPETCDYYRDTDIAKQALIDFYSVDASKFDNLDEAVASITGYDPETAKELFKKAYAAAIEKGYITDDDNDGISDQTVTLTYSSSAETDRQKKMIAYLNEKLDDVTKGTGYDGKIKIVLSAPLGNNWSEELKSGNTDICLAGWTGSVMDPFGITDVYANPDKAYDGNWFDATKLDVTIKLNGEEITMSLYEWSDALNGTEVKKKDKSYNFGYGVADAETRLQILAEFEKAILGTYDYIPMINESYKELLTQQAYYVVEEYNPVMERGGIQYLKYNYDDDEWADYVKDQGGNLKY